jgi:hypothetical protein
MLDLNNAPEKRSEGAIPDGTFAPLKMALKPGGESIAGCAELDLGLFKASLNSDATYLDCEFTVTAGSHAGRKIFQPMTVAGGKLGEDGVSKAWNITHATFRAIIDSALGLDPKDMSDAAKAKRAAFATSTASNSMPRSASSAAIRRRMGARSQIEIALRMSSCRASRNTPR